MDEHTSLFYRFGVALVIGVLVGLQREYAYVGATQSGGGAEDEEGEPKKKGRKKKKSTELFAGVRTFSLFALVGCAAAMLSDVMGSPWPYVVASLTLGGMIAVAYFMEAKAGETGLTTETAAILTFLTGALSYWEQTKLATALAVVMAVLLSLKPELHRLARNLTREDIYATLKFAVITAIVLPILPNRSYGPPPLDVLNPYNIWLMVVFISGLSFLGYVLIKVVGTEHGITLTGLLGGIASSTAVTVSFSRRSKEVPQLARPFALAIIIAWTVMFVRVFVIVETLSPIVFRLLWLPMSVTMLSGLGYGLYLYLAQHTDKREDLPFPNPFELGMAIRFGLIYAIILLISKTAQLYLGDAGIYLSSLLSGLANMNAATLTMIKLAESSGGINTEVAARAILLASLSNMASKGFIALSSGSSALRRALAPGMVIMLVTGIAAAVLL